MASVYLAIHTKTNQRVAIKILKPDLVDKLQIVNRFKKEGLLKLEHANIVKIFSVGNIGNRPYIIMEYVEGMDLDALIRKNRRLSLRKSVSILYQVLSALSYVHRNRIIHRDIKPKNILIDKAGKVKLTDFGIAKTTGSHIKTSTGSYLGAPAYSSPEQIDGKPLDRRTDIYSLGITFYEMLTGVLPYSSDSMEKIFKEKFLGIIVPIIRYRKDLPKKIIDLIEKCIAVNKNNRFKSADEIIKYLENSDGEEKSKRSKKVPVIISSISICVMILILAMVIVLNNRKPSTNTSNNISNVKNNVENEEFSGIDENENLKPIIESTEVEIVDDEGRKLVLEYRFSDQDQDYDYSTVKWFRNGEHIREIDNLKIIDKKYINTGEEWYAEILPYDGKDYGKEIRTNSVIIPARAPQMRIIGNFGSLGSPHGMEIAGNYAFLADCRSGFKILDLDKKNNPGISSQLNPGGHLIDLEINGNEAYVSDSIKGLWIVNIANKNQANIITNVPIPYGAYCLASSNGYSYISNENNEIYIVDLNNYSIHLNNIEMNSFIHNMIARDDYLFIANCNNGFHILNIKDKDNPHIESNINPFAHVEKIALDNNAAYLLDGENSFSIIDINVVDNPILAGSCILPHPAFDLCIKDYLAFVIDSQNTIQIIDITNKKNPKIIGDLKIPDADKVSLINVEGDYLYVIYNTVDGDGNIVSSGLHIIEILIIDD